MLATVNYYPLLGDVGRDGEFGLEGVGLEGADGLGGGVGLFPSLINLGGGGVGFWGVCSF